MHELAIVSDLLAQVERVAVENEARRVARVVVGVGRLAGISSETLALAFERLKINTVAEPAELVTEIEEVALRCGDCGSERPFCDPACRCPRCASPVLRDPGHSHRHDLLALDALACPHCGEVLGSCVGLCPRCGSGSVSVVKGRGILLKSVELER